MNFAVNCADLKFSVVMLENSLWLNMSLRVQPSMCSFQKALIRQSNLDNKCLQTQLLSGNRTTTIIKKVKILFSSLTYDVSFNFVLYIYCVNFVPIINIICIINRKWWCVQMCKQWLIKCCQRVLLSFNICDKFQFSPSHLQ